MLRMLLVRPGSTDLDQQGRIKGSLDIPLNSNGARQVQRLADELDKTPIESIYAAPCLSARQTAEQLAKGREIKIRTEENLRNLDRGLWHGKTIRELKETQPKLYRQWQEHPETVCPPGGETIEDARQRVNWFLQKLKRKHRSGAVAVITPEPLASIIRCTLASCAIGDLWQAECQSGGWESIELVPDAVA